ncbi:MAG: hypothetical protein OXH20_10555 [bacterium]|nr:hypothetical protein [bacterium]MDE0667785.1 hypothetical protein [bacterium]MYE66803.1 hypothetical protein [Acidimicrobiia bacterium]MYJ12945.1 hypothetical protein [Acidimicrobiia bacterium]
MKTTLDIHDELLVRCSTERTDKPVVAAELLGGSTIRAILPCRLYTPRVFRAAPRGLRGCTA